MSGVIRVLVVEDDPAQRGMLADLLENTAGMEACGLAGDGLTGLELAWAREPDVILLDLVLPGVSGMELLRRYRAKGGEAKVMVITRCADEDVSSAALAAGADFFLVKPVAYSEVVADIRFLAGGVRRRCGELLEEMDDPGRTRKPLKGRDFAAQCAGLMAGRRYELLKEIYLEVAISNDTSYDCVEKNIRSFVKAARAVDSETYRRVTGLTGADRQPNNEVFLKALARAAKIPL